MPSTKSVVVPMAARVEACINKFMVRFPGTSASAESRTRYYEAVHQELAPLARELERRNDQLEAASKRLLAALSALDDGCKAPGFKGWENGHSEAVGDEVDAARRELADLLP